MLNELSGCLSKDACPPQFSPDVEKFYPLPEEFGLQAFLPLHQALKEYNFKLVISIAKCTWAGLYWEGVGNGGGNQPTQSNKCSEKSGGFIMKG